MISITLIGQLVSLVVDTFGRIQARRHAREQLSQGERIRGALAQNDANTKLYDEIVREANAQIAEQSAKLKRNLAELEKLFAQLKAEAGN